MNSKPMSELRSILLLGLMAVPLACGDDEEAKAPTGPTQNVVQIAAGNPDFSTLVQAIQAAELQATLSGTGPFTVFAPSNAAFQKLPAGTLEALLTDKEALTRVLTYHVVAGRVLAAQVVGLTKATTVQGDDVTIRVEGNTVFINDARVTTTDILATNGVIHVIDTVLLPAEEAPGNIVEIAAENPDFSTLVAAVQAAGLVETLSGPGPFTVFAPTNAAFNALPSGTVDALLQNIPELTKILTYHVVAGEVDAAEVVAASTLASVQGANLNIRVEGNTVRINDARVTVTDIQAENGVIHVIDAVLIPPTIVDIAAGNPDFSTLVTALQAADLVDTLSGPGPFTVFAPTNAAFAALPPGTVEGLLQNIPALTEVLTYHVVADDVRAAEVVTLTSATTVNGASVDIRVENGTVFIEGARVTVTDIIAGNGVIHVIDAVLLPPSS